MSGCPRPEFSPKTNNKRRRMEDYTFQSPLKRSKIPIVSVEETIAVIKGNLTLNFNSSSVDFLCLVHLFKKMLSIGLCPDSVTQISRMDKFSLEILIKSREMDAKEAYSQCLPRLEKYQMMAGFDHAI
eukprot:TRINITY_DN775932_c0_g1_i1.p1 TRINITY_DN775932_c0_g1~~TRINITY_DN775932_c0_g1_i1.p1  ORF type:complete len:128 (-),score=8.12 TRINITY_DN775932_c0_g1_i1:211-594(-)